MADDVPKLTPPLIEIVAFSPTDDVQLTQAARVLLEAMRAVSSSWPNMDAALGEILEVAKVPGAIVLVALDPAGEVRGLVGGQPMYPGEVMELHPLAVEPAWQKKGIGRLLVRSLEEAAAKAGYSTMLLGADDEAGKSSLAGADLFLGDPLIHLAKLSYPGGHQGGFYEKIGYRVVGVVPDANGFGKPDIWYAKRIKLKK